MAIEKSTSVTPIIKHSMHNGDALERRLDRLGLTENDKWTDRYLLCEHLVDPPAARPRQRFEAVARFIRDLIAHRWVKSRQVRTSNNPKRICYLSMEFLIGRMLSNNILNLAADPLVKNALLREGWDPSELADQEPDAGLGSGGLGRLAACFIDSLATMEYPAIGYGLRYEYGSFRQSIRNGYQIEEADNWLRESDPWQVARPGKEFHVPLNATVELRGSTIHVVPGRPSTLIGISYDRPVIGYGGRCVNTLRLFAAAAPKAFDFAEFSHGDFARAVIGNVAAESLTRVLYPDDSTAAGRNLRFMQEYFMVSCAMQDIVQRFTAADGDHWSVLPDRVAIQLNDTHPAIAVAELMRILLDEANLTWDEAWDLTVRTLAYTNHTLLPEALETWPVELFEQFLPRHLEIVYEINERLLREIDTRFAGDSGRRQRMSLIEEGPVRKIRMAHLAVVGSHSTNGVSEVHSSLLQSHVLRDFFQMFPERFNNKTNGVSPRRWLLQANPPLAELITSAIGDSWITDLSQLNRLAPMAGDGAFRERFLSAKRQAKIRFVDWLRRTSGYTVDPDTLFDCQIKRIHEYKRQLLNVLHIIVLYNRLRAQQEHDTSPRTFFFAGKAAPAYGIAKLIIKLINNVARTIHDDPVTRGHLRVLFLPEYNVSLAERLIPACDLSEQISTAGFEASGTSNMKFMMNGALTIGTRDGATIEIAREVGEDSIFLFGLTADEVINGRGWYNPEWHYANEPETRDAINLLFSDHFCRHEPGIFTPLRESLLSHGDYFMNLADLSSYASAQAKAGALYADAHSWAAKAILNVACSGKFSSDRTISEYASEIWDAQPCPIPDSAFGDATATEH
jgi:starch phosphorylase